MSFLKNILKPFVEFKEGSTGASPDIEKQNEKTPDTSDPATQNSSDESRPSPAVDSSVPNAGSGTATTDYSNYFEKLIDEANAKNPVFQGTDFKEFIDSKIDVETIADEGTRYKTAFNVLKRTGLTKEKLVMTGQEYIKIIDVDLKGFENAFNQHYKTEVEQKEQLLQQKAADVQALTEKISALDIEMNKLSQEITQSKDKLISNKQSFLLAGESKKKEIQSELEKINQYF